MIIILAFILGFVLIFNGLFFFAALYALWPLLFVYVLYLAYVERNQQRRWKQEQVVSRGKV